MLSVTLFGGCMKANSASCEDVYNLFVTNTSSLVYKSEDQVGSSILTKQNSDTYYFEFTLSKTNANLRQVVNNSSEQNKHFNMLANGNEYHLLISHAEKYFFNKFNSSIMKAYTKEQLESVKQANLTTLYYQVQNTTSSIENFGKFTRELESCYNDLTATSQSTKYALDDLLNSYKTLIKNVIEMNMTTQDIIDNSLFKASSTSSLITKNDIQRLVDAFELYVTKYMYIRYMAFDSNTLLSFKSNSLLTKMESIVNKIGSVSDKTGTSATEAYNYLMLVEKNIRTDFDVLENASKILNGSVPQSTDKDYDYKNSLYNYLTSYEGSMMEYLDSLSTLVG